MKRLKYWFCESTEGQAYNLRAKNLRTLRAKWKEAVSQGCTFRGYDNEQSDKFSPARAVVDYQNLVDLIDEASSEFGICESANMCTPAYHRAAS